MQKNDIITAEILAQGATGEGIAKPDGYTLFVPFAVKGDVCRLRVLKTGKHFGYAKIEEILSPSEIRVTPPCSVFGKCGGCALMHMQYKAQLLWKEERVRDALCRIGGQKEIRVFPVAHDDVMTGYRNKIQIPVAEGADGQPVAGFFALNSHKVVPAEKCLLQSEKCRNILDGVLLWMRKHNIPAYNEQKHTGLVRHIYVREGIAGQRMVSIVTRTKALPHAEELIEAMKAFGVTTLLQNINGAKTNVILGTETRILYGEGFLKAAIGPFVYKVSHHSFFQVNAPVAAMLYQKGLELLGDIADKTVFDLYCGIGSISLFLAQKARRVIGVEIVPEAVEDAKENAKNNGITNASFYAGDAGAVVKELKGQGISADIAVVDPPRKGCDPKLLETLLSMQPEKILYVSCNPATLARDIKILADAGYSTDAAYPFDLFPHTCHVESVALLTLSN